LPAALLVISFGQAQTPDTNEQAKLLALIKDVQTQQAQMAENEKKIEEKLNDLSDIIRDARIYTKRAR
jgi:hypothetical protein